MAKKSREITIHSISEDVECGSVTVGTDLSNDTGDYPIFIRVVQDSEIGETITLSLDEAQDLRSALGEIIEIALHNAGK